MLIAIFALLTYSNRNIIIKISWVGIIFFDPVRSFYHPMTYSIYKDNKKYFEKIHLKTPYLCSLCN